MRKDQSNRSATARTAVYFCDFALENTTLRPVAKLIILLLFAAAAPAATLTVSAAISLKESLLDIRRIYEAHSPDRLSFNFDASGKLAAQIQRGAPVDLFISADDEQMNLLMKSGCIVSRSSRVVADNTLVLIAPAGAADPPTSFADLATGHIEKIAVGEPRSVPAGRYAMQTLKAMHLDGEIRDRLVFGESVRQVLTYVEQGQVYAGIVYATDANVAAGKVKVVATAEEGTHEKIEYPAAVVAKSQNQAAGQIFLDFLNTRAARSILSKRGFSIPADQSASTRPVP